LKANPYHPSLRLKVIGPYWVVRVSRGYRALARRKDNDFFWFWIGPHDEYDRILKMSFSPASVTRWTGDVTVDHQGYRVLGAGAQGTMQPTSRPAVNFPAILLLRVYGMNGKLDAKMCAAATKSCSGKFWKDSGSRAGDVM
jgi:hypothetical protein